MGEKMDSTVDALKNVYSAKGGNITNVENITTIPDMIEAITSLIESTPQPIKTSKLNLYGLDTNDLEDIAPIHNNRILFFNEDFDGDKVDNDYFIVHNNSKQGDLSVRKKENVTVSNSICHIVGTKEQVQYNGATYNYTTGALQSRLHFQNCLIESKIKYKGGNGWRNAYWTCGYNVTGLFNWPICGEFDYFEDERPNKAVSTIHYSSKWGDASKRDEFATVKNQTVDNKFYKETRDEDWHIYGCEFSQGKIRLYFDNVLFKEYDTTQMTYTENVNPFDFWQHWIWDLYALSNDAEGSVYMDVDWVRAWTLENETVEDIIPQSVAIEYLGNSNRLEAENKIQVGTGVQFYPIYTPSTVPIAANISDKTTFSASNNDIIYLSGGGLRFNSEGNTRLTYTDIVGTSTNIDLVGYSKDLPDGNVALENFDVQNADVKWGAYTASQHINDLLSDTDLTFGKRLHYGIFEAEPSTSYNFTRQNRYDNEKIEVVELDANKRILKTTEFIDSGTFITLANTNFVLLQGYLSSNLVLNDLLRVKAHLRGNFKPTFSKA